MATHDFLGFEADFSYPRVAQVQEYYPVIRYGAEPIDPVKVTGDPIELKVQ